MSAQIVCPSILSTMQCRVFRYLAQGYTTKQAARELGMNVKTVDKHRQRALAKLGMRENWQLVGLGFEWRVSA